MLGRLRAEHPGTPILFVSLGDRYLPVEALSTTPLGADALAVQAASSGRPQFYFLDQRPAFSRDWAAHQRRFEAADGGHWNAHANRLVAETPAALIEENHLRGGSPNTAVPAGNAQAVP